MVRVVRCSSRDALETADASRLVRARFREGRNEEDGVYERRRRKRGKLRARERERERERESGTARDNVNVCVVAPKHSQRTDGD